MKKTVLVLLSLAALPAGAFASDCSHASTQAELTACVGDDARLADSALNAIYTRLAHGLEGDDRLRLRDAERAWITFRDRHCAFVAGPTAGGSISAMVTADCVAKLTTQRAAQLLEQLTCAEGDVTCVR